MQSRDTFDSAWVTTTCRDRLRQLLEAVEDAGTLSREQAAHEVAATGCPEGHDLHVAALGGYVNVDGDAVALSRAGRDWLLEAGRPAPEWDAVRTPGSPPLRTWQVEALDAWAAHARHGVVEAVTGTGKSRVGVEAVREALDDDYNVVVMVPTVDLVLQWARTLRQHHVSSVGTLGDGSRADFSTHRVVVGTVQSLYPDPPTRADGKVLMIADECHRYGAEAWRRALHPSYRRRLGLTATFERNDDGLKHLLAYFGGSPVHRIGFPRAIADGVVAHYDVHLLGVDLTPPERAFYDKAEKAAKDARLELLAADFPAEPFGAFMHAVQEAADRDPDPTVQDAARRYLKAFSQKVDAVTNAEEKLRVIRLLAARVQDARGAIVFTRRVDTSEALAGALVEEGVNAVALHSESSRTERQDVLTDLKVGRVQAVVAPTILDEGIDVPDIDLALVMGGSRSRRQMIQRMGRVLRLKKDGGKATFVVVYAKDTTEDITVTDGSESCLDLIVESADSVTRLEVVDGRLRPSAENAVLGAPAGAQPEGEGQGPGGRKPEPAPSSSVASDASPIIDSSAVAVDFRAIRSGRRLFDLDPASHRSAEDQLREILDADLAGEHTLSSNGRLLDLHGQRARWTLGDGGRVLHEVASDAPRPAGAATGGARPPAARVLPPARTKHRQEKPMVLGPAFAQTVAFGQGVVVKAARAMALPRNPARAEAELRALLAADLRRRPRVTRVMDRLVIHGDAAAWTLRSQDRTVVGVANKRPRPSASTPHRVDEAPRPVNERPVPSHDATAVTGVAKTTAQELDPSAADGTSTQETMEPSPENQPVSQPEASSPALDLVSQLERLAALREKGLLTEAEFSAAKARLLG